MLTEFQAAITALRLLFDVYKLRRDVAKESATASGSNPPDSEPSPERIGELIKELEQSPSETKEALSAAIEKKFPAPQATQVKQDLAALSLLTNPLNFSDYDYYGLISQYVRGLQSIAARTELFRLRGWKNPLEIRILPLPTTASAIAPPEIVQRGVHTYGEVAQASVTKAECFLTDEDVEVPLTLIVDAKFIDYSYVSYCGQSITRASQTYRFEAGQERNWLEFGPLRALKAGFTVFSYLLKAADAKAIIQAMRQDITAHVRDIEDERPVVKELGDEVAALLKALPKA